MPAVYTGRTMAEMLFVRRMKMKRIVIPFIALACGAVVAIALWLRPTTGTLEVPDVGAPWERTVADPVRSLASGTLAIHVVGELDGDAILSTSYGDIALPSGRVDTLLIGAEAWLSKCHLAYAPGKAVHGHLSIRVGLGSGAAWARHPIGDTVPANYVGGWTTWYPGRKHIYSQGFFFRGEKKGTWTYWDEKGNVLKVEEWQDGKLIETRTANQASYHREARLRLNTTVGSKG